MAAEPAEEEAMPEKLTPETEYKILAVTENNGTIFFQAQRNGQTAFFMMDESDPDSITEVTMEKNTELFFW